MQGCRNYDRQAQFEIYKLYSKAMYNISLRIVAKEEDAEDVLQNAFLSAFTKIEQFSGKVTFGAWLKRIVINKSIDYVKKKKISFVDIEKVDFRLTDENDNDEELLFYKDRLDQVHDKIKKLPDKCRVIFSLFMLEGYDHNEIAEILNISVSTSKSQVHRAKKLLREKLEMDLNAS